MPTITIETYLSNSDFGGWERASQQVAKASSMEAVVEALEFLLEDAELDPMTPEERASIQVQNCEFVEADSTRMHGTCYFNVNLNVAESLANRLL